MKPNALLSEVIHPVHGALHFADARDLRDVVDIAVVHQIAFTRAQSLYYDVGSELDDLFEIVLNGARDEKHRA